MVGDASPVRIPEQTAARKPQGAARPDCFRGHTSDMRLHDAAIELMEVLHPILVG